MEAYLRVTLNQSVRLYMYATEDGLHVASFKSAVLQMYDWTLVFLYQASHMYALAVIQFDCFSAIHVRMGNKLTNFVNVGFLEY